MQFSYLAKTFSSIENLSARLEMTKILADTFNSLSPEELQETIYLLQGRVVPLYEKLEFGMAEKSVVKSVIKAFQLDTSIFTQKVKEFGDVGRAVEELRQETALLTQLDKELAISDVYRILRAIPEMSGTGSQDKKSAQLGSLLQQLDPLSCRYIMRIVLSTLRLGFSDMTILDGLSWMISGDKSLRPSLLRAYQMRPDLGYIGRLLKEKGIRAVEKVIPVVFTPIIMMRAERLSSATDIINQIGVCAVEPKYDGFRVQIHMNIKGNVKIFSRNLEEVSAMFPDIVSGIQAAVKGHECIVEGEAVGYDTKTGQLVPFQETVQRKRKYDVEDKAKQLPLRVFIFELLYFDGKHYLDSVFSDRRAKIEKLFPLGSGDVQAIAETVVTSPEKLDELFEEAIQLGKEGIIAKKTTGMYQPGARGWNWIKFKRSYSSKIHDTIDCVVMGYDAGKGKRTGFGIGAFLVGVYDEIDRNYKTIAKIGTGLSDEEWKQLFAQCQPYIVRDKPKEYDVDKQMTVDSWITPTIIVEIKADEITRSPVHTAGRIMGQSKSGQALIVTEAGYALRFPRLVQFRTDKSPNDATTTQELKEMEKMQLSGK